MNVFVAVLQCYTFPPPNNHLHLQHHSELWTESNELTPVDVTVRTSAPSTLTPEDVLVIKAVYGNACDSAKDTASALSRWSYLETYLAKSDVKTAVAQDTYRIPASDDGREVEHFKYVQVSLKEASDASLDSGPSTIVVNGKPGVPSHTAPVSTTPTAEQRNISRIASSIQGMLADYEKLSASRDATMDLLEETWAGYDKTTDRIDKALKQLETTQIASLRGASEKAMAKSAGEEVADGEVDVALSVLQGWQKRCGVFMTQLELVKQSLSSRLD